ncbi:hypothetical protein IFM89_018596 [Coptis chinensis]|uniref:Protein kinase domain-containing protein n=1 Tax=Coptis chinensis TaxID=261450 RepID=A0A835I3D6_9MAGN|nr:hypothetical protein IFM89_018596 [Coptis chinensis]
MRRFAIKRINNVFDNCIDALKTLWELKLLRHLRHENVIALKDVMVPIWRRSFKDVYPPIRKLLDFVTVGCSSNTSLSWIVRVQIALDTTVVTDFGLAKLVGKTSCEGEASATRAVGTFGYLALE